MGSIKDKEFLDEVSDCQLLKKAPTPTSELSFNEILV
jgi:hypothetical protein